MPRDVLWWPQGTIQASEEHVEGSGQHPNRKGGASTDHLFTLKQLSGYGVSKIIWACACGDTYSRKVIV